MYTEDCTEAARIMLLLLLLSLGAIFTDCSYIGCLNATMMEDFLHDSWENSSMTVAMCSQNCSERNYTMYSLRYGHYCYCGNYSSPDELLEHGSKDDECNKPCYGASETCGGNRAIEIYVKYSLYLGCFSFNPNDFKLKQTNEVSGANMNRKFCSARCVGYPYFGLAQSNKCYCITEFPCPWEMLPETECDLRCLGGEKCGGSGYVAVWNYTEDVQDTTGADVADCDGKSSDASGTASPSVSKSDLLSTTEAAGIAPDDATGDHSTTESTSWFFKELTDGISVLAVILIVLAFISGALIVVCVICSLRTYESRKLMMEVRRRMEAKYAYKTGDEQFTSVEMDPVKPDETGNGDLKRAAKASIKYSSVRRTAVDDAIPVAETHDFYADVKKKEISEDVFNIEDAVGSDVIMTTNIAYVEYNASSMDDETLQRQEILHNITDMNTRPIPSPEFIPPPSEFHHTVDEANKDINLSMQETYSDPKNPPFTNVVKEDVTGPNLENAPDDIASPNDFASINAPTANTRPGGDMDNYLAAEPFRNPAQHFGETWIGIDEADENLRNISAGVIQPLHLNGKKEWDYGEQEIQGDTLKGVDHDDFDQSGHTEEVMGAFSDLDGTAGQHEGINGEGKEANEIHEASFPSLSTKSPIMGPSENVYALPFEIDESWPRSKMISIHDYTDLDDPVDSKENESTTNWKQNADNIKPEKKPVFTGNKDPAFQDANTSASTGMTVSHENQETDYSFKYNDAETRQGDPDTDDIMGADTMASEEALYATPFEI